MDMFSASFFFSSKALVLCKKYFKYYVIALSVSPWLCLLHRCIHLIWLKMEKNVSPSTIFQLDMIYIYIWYCIAIPWFGKGQGAVHAICPLLACAKQFIKKTITDSSNLWASVRRGSVRRTTLCCHCVNRAVFIMVTIWTPACHRTNSIHFQCELISMVTWHLPWS